MQALHALAEARMRRSRVRSGPLLAPHPQPPHVDETALPSSLDARSHQPLPVASLQTSTPPDKPHAAESNDNPPTTTARSFDPARTADSQTDTANRGTSDDRAARKQNPSRAPRPHAHRSLPTGSPETRCQKSDMRARGDRSPSPPESDRKSVV